MHKTSKEIAFLGLKAKPKVWQESKKVNFLVRQNGGVWESKETIPKTLKNAQMTQPSIILHFKMLL
jgi:hypothetical protein